MFKKFALFNSLTFSGLLTVAPLALANPLASINTSVVEIEAQSKKTEDATPFAQIVNLSDSVRERPRFQQFQIRAIVKQDVASPFANLAPATTPVILEDYGVNQIENVAADVEPADVKLDIKPITYKNKPRHKIGEELYDQYEPFLEALEQKYGVDPQVVMGIWGIETHYGMNFGRTPIREALVSYLRKRPDRRKFVNGELAAAARLESKGIVDPDKMVGSYAGAMGHTQFIPSSVERFAVDGSGDGKIDMWDPKDALASTANYLAKHGWKKGQNWGVEVNVPSSIFSRPGAKSRQPMSFWKDKGVVAKHSGSPIPEKGYARLQRYKGRTFLLNDNFFVIMTYNHSTEYAYQVASLGDQVLFPSRAGVSDIALSINGPDVGRNWGTRGGTKVASKPSKKSGGGSASAKSSGTTAASCGSETCRIQRALQKRGLYSGPIDGVAGKQLQRAIVKFQVANRLPPDGRITKLLSRKLR